MKKEDHDALMKMQAHAAGKRMAARMKGLNANSSPNGLNDFLKESGKVPEERRMKVRGEPE